MSHETTYVTAYFNITNLENLKRFSANEYINYSKFLMKQDINLCIFTQEEYAEQIADLRKPFQTKTKIITCDFKSLPFYHYCDEMNKILKAKPIRNCGTPVTAHYNIIMWSKMAFVKQAIDFNPFDSKYFAWIDFGISKSCITQWVDEDKIFEITSDKILIAMINNNFEFVNWNDQYLGGLSWIVGGGFILGNAEHMRWFALQQNKYLKKCIKLGFAPDDEMLIPLIIKDNPDKFDLYPCDHSGILANLRHFRINLNLINHSIHLEKNYLIGLHVLRSYLDRKIKCSSENFHIFLNKFFNSVFKQDRELAIYLYYISYNLRLKSENNFKSLDMYKLSGDCIFRTNFTVEKPYNKLEYDTMQLPGFKNKHTLVQFISANEDKLIEQYGGITLQKLIDIGVSQLYHELLEFAKQLIQDLCELKICHGDITPRHIVYSNKFKLINFSHVKEWSDELHRDDMRALGLIIINYVLGVNDIHNILLFTPSDIAEIKNNFKKKIGDDIGDFDFVRQLVTG